MKWCTHIAKDTSCRKITCSNTEVTDPTSAHCENYRTRTQGLSMQIQNSAKAYNAWPHSTPEFLKISISVMYIEIFIFLIFLDARIHNIVDRRTCNNILFLKQLMTVLYSAELFSGIFILSSFTYRSVPGLYPP